MNINALFKNIRYALHDTGKSVYSDFQLLNALNIVTSRIWSIFYAKDSPLFLRKTKLPVTARMVALPLNCTTILEVNDNTEKTLYAVPTVFDIGLRGYFYDSVAKTVEVPEGVTQVEVWYVYKPDEITSISGDIDLDQRLEPVLTKAIAAYVRGDEAAVDAVFNAFVGLPSGGDGS